VKRDLSEDSKKMKRVFNLSVDELENVLTRKKPPTDITKIALVSASTYSRIKSTEVHEKALEIMMKKGNLKITLGED
jgi:uncharacterized protein (DUF2384 family)